MLELITDERRIISEVWDCINLAKANNLTPIRIYAPLQAEYFQSYPVWHNKDCFVLATDKVGCFYLVSNKVRDWQYEVSPKESFEQQVQDELED